MCLLDTCSSFFNEVSLRVFNPVFIWLSFYEHSHAIWKLSHLVLIPIWTFSYLSPRSPVPDLPVFLLPGSWLACQAICHCLWFCVFSKFSSGTFSFHVKRWPGDCPNLCPLDFSSFLSSKACTNILCQSICGPRSNIFMPRQLVITDFPTWPEGEALVERKWMTSVSRIAAYVVHLFCPVLLVLDPICTTYEFLWISSGPS